MTDSENLGFGRYARSQLVLIGARSRAGRAISRLWPEKQIISVHRGAGPGITLTDYRDIRAEIIPENSTVVNCVGSPHGSLDALQQVNMDVALGWAYAARARGASQFIQISSFSVYGPAECIDQHTPEQPVSDYGRVKLEADRALLAHSRPDSLVAALRVPMLFGEGKDKLSQLVAVIRKLGAVPLPAATVQRSMLSYRGLAHAIARIAADRREGVVLFADPVPFDYELLAARMREVTGRAPRRFGVPSAASALVRWLLPSLHSRVLASSLLAAPSALECSIPEAATLVAHLDHLISQGG